MLRLAKVADRMLLNTVFLLHNLHLICSGLDLLVVAAPPTPSEVNVDLLSHLVQVSGRFLSCVNVSICRVSSWPTMLIVFAIDNLVGL